MNNFNELEQRALDALTALIPELIKKNGMLDMKKIIPEFYFNVLIAAYQAPNFVPTLGLCKGITRTRRAV